MADMVSPFAIARFSVEQYHRMIESGALGENDRVELLDGWVVEKMAKGPEHEYATGEAQALLQKGLPADWHIRNQAPVTLAESEPEPDLSIVRGGRADYKDHHPGPEDITLVVEVADTTLATDRSKAKIYARAGIPEYWIVNLSERTLEVHTDPEASDEPRYASCHVFRERDRVRVVIGGCDAGTVAVADLLP